MVVGVLGGMGPAATADFYAKLVSATPATTDQEHLRVVIWSDPTIPDRTRALLQGGEDPTPAMVQAVRSLAALGATMIAVPCNTAHAFLPCVQRHVQVPFVDMIEETVAHLAAEGPRAQVVGLLASTGTQHAGLYQNKLGAAGVEVVSPDRDSQRQVMRAIELMKAGERGRATAILDPVARELVFCGAEVLIAGCTEIPLLIDDGALPVSVIDPTRVLAEAVVRRVLAPAQERRG